MPTSSSIDEVHGTELVLEHLVGLGHQQIAHVDGGTGAGGPQRRAAYVRGMKERRLGRHVQVISGDFTEEAGVSAARELTSRPSSDQLPTAIFAANDIIAAGLLGGLDRAGVAVPGEVSIVGYDNIGIAHLAHVSLTTVDQPRDRDGPPRARAAARPDRQPAAERRAGRRADARRPRDDGGAPAQLTPGRPPLTLGSVRRVSGKERWHGRNRTMPSSTVVPVLVYEDVSEAVEWLVDTFGFIEHWRAGNHRAQLSVGDGAVVVGERRVAEAHETDDPTIFRAPRRGEVSHSIMVRVDDVDAHYQRARQGGARILRPPGDFPRRRAAVHDRRSRRSSLDVLAVDRGRHAGGLGWDDSAGCRLIAAVGWRWGRLCRADRLVNGGQRRDEVQAGLRLEPLRPCCERG